MKLYTYLLVGSSAVLATADNWSPPGPDDVRGPCPMLNALANHGYLDHSGKNLEHDAVVNTLNDVLFLSKDLGDFFYNFGLTGNKRPDNTTFDLSDLLTHNIVEFDASLSRQDSYLGNAQQFNASIFAETTSYWTADVLDIGMIVESRQARVNTSNATNPAFSWWSLPLGGSRMAQALFTAFIGDPVAGTVEKEKLEYFFEQERLPTELGWVRPTAVFDNPAFESLQARIEAAESQ
ncbi:Chloroperoxidase [Xylariomycetidae sp. FL2044]|nr:Chloroperoxidase [Xylariomycetidae sp. FL2044]